MGPTLEVAQAEADNALPSRDGLLVVHEVTVGFGGLLALDQVSMLVGAGEIVGVIGPNGAGKTTLFNVICGFVHPDSGFISYRGKKLRRQHPHDLAKLGIARTLQGVGLCAGLTVHENVMLGAQPALRGDLGSAFLGLWRSSREERRTAARAMDVLEELGIADYARKLPVALPYGVPSAITMPKFRTTKRSHTDMTRSMWCSTKRTAIRSLSPRICDPRSSMSRSDSPLAGSSNRRTCGFIISARASDVLFCTPYGSATGSLRA